MLSCSTDPTTKFKNYKSGFSLLIGWKIHENSGFILIRCVKFGYVRNNCSNFDRKSTMYLIETKRPFKFLLALRSHYSLYWVSGAPSYTGTMKISTFYNSFSQVWLVCCLVIGRNWILWFHWLEEVHRMSKFPSNLPV